MGTYNCPACGADDVAHRAVCRCGADLSLLQRLDGIADAWFNRALAALAEGAPGRALEWLSASCTARPSDAAARRAQAKVWAQLGRWAEARDALQRAAALEPDAPELALLRQAFKEAEAPLKPARAQTAAASPALPPAARRAQPTTKKRKRSRD
jgi:tetratricopeptide (TPR) repeat protein